MIKETLERIFDEFPIAKTQGFSGHPLANYIRSTVPATLKNMFPDKPELIWSASPGKGQWVDAPWIAAFDPLVTETAQNGYYPVYLFTYSLDAVYLSLNQGMTALRDEFGDVHAVEILRNRAGILRSRLKSEFTGIFLADKIDLQAKTPHTRLAFYEPGHVFGIKYYTNNLPSNEKLREDLALMLELYSLATVRGGVDEFDTATENDDRELSDADVSLEEKRNYRYHRTIERNGTLSKRAKQVHGYKCQICNFDFVKVYGTLGSKYIEAHHKIPLSKLPENKTKLSAKDDFAVVCANCHRMLHRKGAPETFDEFLKFYQSLQS